MYGTLYKKRNGRTLISLRFCGNLELHRKGKRLTQGITSNEVIVQYSLDSQPDKLYDYTEISNVNKTNNN
jgi:hypothetical protein